MAARSASPAAALAAAFASFATPALVAPRIRRGRPHRPRTRPRNWTSSTRTTGKPLKLNPLQATFRGDNRYKRPDAGFLFGRIPQAVARLHRALAGQGGTIGSDGPEQGQDLISYDIFVRDAKESLEGSSSRLDAAGRPDGQASPPSPRSWANGHRRSRSRR